MHKMFERLQLIVQQNCLLDLTKPLVVGVSGGPDSLCLLDVLHRLGLRIIVAHLNHGLRTEAESEAIAVEKIARNMGVPFVSEKADVARYAENHSLSLEDAARIIRYQFLFAKAHQIDAQAVAVAHTADDQVETILMHLLSGAGLSGLKGMSMHLLPNPWSQEIPLVRPLLTTWRDEVIRYCQAYDLKPVLDRTNWDTCFTRNRLRHVLIPFLEQDFPGLQKTILRMAQVLTGDEQIIEGIIDAAWQQCRPIQGEGYIIIHAPTLSQQLIGVQRRLLRRAMAKLRPGSRGIDFNAIEQAVEFIHNPPRSRRADLAAGLSVFLEEEKLFLYAWEADLPEADWPQMPAEMTTIKLKAPGSITISPGWILESELVEETGDDLPSALSNDDPYQAWINADNLSLPLTIRGRCPGDRFQPIGLGKHTQKLSDFMINVKLPRRARDKWPLVCTDSEIVWVPGYRLADSYRILRTTRKTMHLRLSRFPKPGK